MSLDVDRETIYSLSQQFDNYRMRKGKGHVQMIPSGKYIFVRPSQGDILMHQRYRHPVLAQGKPVLYAGEAYFRSGELQWWSNASGNYRPDAAHAEQAGLPMEQFYTFEQVMSGTVGRRVGDKR